MANPLRGEVEWMVNGREYILRLSIGDLVALDNLEEGKNGCMALVSRLTSQQYGVNDLTNVLQRALKTGCKVSLKREEIYELIDEAEWESARDVVIEVLMKRLIKEKPDDKAKDEESNSAPLPQRNTGDD